MKRTEFDAKRFADAVKARRGGAKFRETAKEIGTSAATLLRVEKGKSCETETFTKLCAWLETPPGAFFKDVEK